MKKNNTNNNTNNNNPQTGRVFDQFVKEFNKFNMNGNSTQNQPPLENKNSQIYDDRRVFSGNNGINTNNNMNNINSNNNITDPSLFNVFSNMSDNNKSQPQPQAYDFTIANSNGSQMFLIDEIPKNLSKDEIKEKMDQIINKWV